MKLAQHFEQLYNDGESLLLFPAEIRRVLIEKGITPSIGQVRGALKKYFDASTKKAAAFHSNLEQYLDSLGASSLDQYVDSLQAAEDKLPNYHCKVCEMYGADYFADDNGIVWIDGITACEFNQRIAERTAREDEKMRRDMTYIFGASDNGMAALKPVPTQ